MPYAIDLFCGAGGMSEGLIQAGFHILFSSDISEDVMKTYVNRHEQLGLIQGYNTYFHKGDVRELTGDFIFEKIRNLEFFKDKKLDIPLRIDAIFGGPPCQGFSRAGKRNIDDPRNLLFKEYLRVINQVHPKYVVMENVEGFNDTKFHGFIGVTGNVYKDGTTAPEILINEFSLIGYNVLQPQVLDASDFGVPQRRRRAIFIAYMQNENVPTYPNPTVLNNNKVTVEDAISDLIRDNKIRPYQETEYQVQSKLGRTPDITRKPIPCMKNVCNNEVSNHQKLIVERFSLFHEGEDGNAVRRRILSQGIDLSRKPHLLADCSRKLKIDQNILYDRFLKANISDEMIEKLITKKTIRTRLCRNKPSLTVVTLPDDYISPFENRVFSVREMARLQSFDDSFEFLSKRTTGGARRKFEVPQYTQVGNAVPPLLAKAIAKQIIKALKGED